jgi:hypothetical protein
MKTNWKTTALGIITIITSLGTIAKSFLEEGNLGDISTHIAAITAGIGLIFAKDYKN